MMSAKASMWFLHAWLCGWMLWTVSFVAIVPFFPLASPIHPLPFEWWITL